MAETMSERLSALQFWVLWRHFSKTGEPYPKPILLQVDRELGYWGAADLYARTLLDTLSRLTPESEQMLRLLTTPEYRVAIGVIDASDADNDLRRISAHSAWKDGMVVVARQVPDDNPRTGGEVILRTVSSGAWVQTMVDLLPEAAKGKLPAVKDVMGQHADTGLSPTTYREESLAAARQKLLEPRTSWVGDIEIVAGRPGDQQIKHRFQFFDRPGDGRYLATIGEYIDVEPADNAHLVGRLTRTLNNIRREFDQLRDDAHIFHSDAKGTM